VPAGLPQYGYEQALNPGKVGAVLERPSNPNGTFQITGTSLKGGPVDFRARWTATYIREADTWKIRMQTVVPLPPK
jgi:hypothetical protein